MTVRLLAALLCALAPTTVLLGGCGVSTPPRPEPPRATDGAAPPVNPFRLVRRDTRGMRVATLREALELPADELDIGRAALLLAREDRPSLDLPTYLARLDALADELRDFVVEHPGMSRRDAFAAFVYGRFTWDADDPLGHSVENLYLDRVLDRGRGYCVSLSLLGFALAERIGLPLEGVRIPFHYYVRLDGRNIETTAGGREDPTSSYAQRAGASADSGPYLRPVPPRSVFADLLSNRGGLAFRAGDIRTARDSLQLALEVDEGLPFAWHNLGLVEMGAGDWSAAVAAFDRAIALDPAAGYSYARRAEAHLRLGERASAASDLQRALEHTND